MSLFIWAEYDCIRSIGATAKEYTVPIIYPYIGTLFTYGLLFLGYFSKKVTEPSINIERPKSIAVFFKRRHWLFYSTIVCFLIPPILAFQEVGKIVEQHIYEWTLPFNCALIFFSCFGVGILTRIEDRKKIELLDDFNK